MWNLLQAKQALDLFHKNRRETFPDLRTELHSSMNDLESSLQILVKFGLPLFGFDRARSFQTFGLTFFSKKFQISHLFSLGLLKFRWYFHLHQEAEALASPSPPPTVPLDSNAI